MQPVVSDKPYAFVPPYHGRFWAAVLQLYLPRHLSKAWGVESVECRGAERLASSLAAGHGILLAPNHSRHCDPLVLGYLSRAVRCPFFAMASWHLFMNGGFRAWLLNKMGAFSVFREGMDRAAVNAAIEILVSAERPLVIFPEGVVSRANDRLNTLMEGTAFIARTAAKRRAKLSPPGQVVVHPVAIKYQFDGDVNRAIEPVLAEIEARLSWRPKSDLPLVERIVKVGEALLCLKELELLGQPQSGPIEDRLTRLIDHLLVPLEKEWTLGKRESHAVGRVKGLRSAILPDMIKGELSEAEKVRRWRQLDDCYLAQQLSWYPPNYLRSQPSPERLLETVERFEEDLTDQVRAHRPISVVIEVGQPLVVSPERDRAAASDPVLDHIEAELTAMLARLARPSP